MRPSGQILEGGEEGLAAGLGLARAADGHHGGPDGVAVGLSLPAVLRPARDQKSARRHHAVDRDDRAADIAEVDRLSKDALVHAGLSTTGRPGCTEYNPPYVRSKSRRKPAQARPQRRPSSSRAERMARSLAFLKASQASSTASWRRDGDLSRRAAGRTAVVFMAHMNPLVERARRSKRCAFFCAPGPGESDRPGPEAFRADPRSPPRERRQGKSPKSPSTIARAGPAFLNPAARADRRSPPSPSRTARG